MIPTIQTKHLVLRPFTTGDVQPLFEVFSQPGVLQYFPNPQPPAIDRVQRFVDFQLKHWQEYQYGNWVICLPHEPTLIGWAGLQYLPETSETEVGYLLSPLHWGKGCATEAARAAIADGFSRVRLAEIIALVHPDNLASLKVAEKCGMRVAEKKKYWGLEMVRHIIRKEDYEQS